MLNFSMKPDDFELFEIRNVLFVSHFLFCWLLCSFARVGLVNYTQFSLYQSQSIRIGNFYLLRIIVFHQKRRRIAHLAPDSRRFAKWPIQLRASLFLTFVLEMLRVRSPVQLASSNVGHRGVGVTIPVKDVNRHVEAVQGYPGTRIAEISPA